MKKLLGLTACALCISMCTSVCAETMLSYKVDNSLVTYSVDDNGKATAFADKAQSAYFYAKEIVAENGKITDNFRIPEYVPSGEYTISVVADGGEEELFIRHMNTTQATLAVNQIIRETTANGIKGKIGDNIADLGISPADFTTYGDAVSAYLAASSKSTDEKDFWNDYHAALILAKTSVLTDDSLVDAVLETDAEYMGFGYTAFKGYASDVKNAVYTKLKTGVATESNLSDILEIWTGLARLNDAEDKSEYEQLLINDYAAVLGIDVSKFTNATRKDEIIGEIMAPIAGYATASALVTAYDAAIVKYPNPSNGGGGGSSGGGGGSSGDGGSQSGSASGEVGLPNTPYGEEDKTKEKVFSDVDNKHWARDIIAELKDRGIVSGSDGKFNPNNSISRAEFSTMIAQCFYKGESASGNVKFADVSSADWYYSYTTLLAEKGIVNGVGNGMFSPNSMITREDMAVIAVRCLSSKIDVTDTDYLSFIDSDRVADYAKSAVAVLTNENILSGTPEGMFYPKNNLTRAEAAVVVYKLLERLEA